MRHKLARAIPERLTPDQSVAHLAALQHGVTSIRQMLEAGLTRDAVTRRVRAGRLHQLHRGVYAVGHSGLSNEGSWMAAVLACGAGAVLSHRSAAELWGLLPVRLGLIEVSIATDSGRGRRPGVRIHRCASLPSATTDWCKSIPVTTPARTIADLRRTASVDDVRKAIREAQFQRLRLDDEAAKEEELTRSKLERNFIRVCRRHRLPRPEVNVRVGPFEVDFLWREHRLVVETDGWQAHSGQMAFEEDRARDLDLKLLGFDVVRFTYSQVTTKPHEVAAKLRVLLSR